MNKTRTVVCYMDKVDFDYELGEASGGNRVYASEADLRKRQPCTKECGVVQVEVALKKVVQQSDFSGAGKLAKDWTTKDTAALKKRIRNHLINVAAQALTVLTKKEQLQALTLAKKKKK